MCSFILVILMEFLIFVYAGHLPIKLFDDRVLKFTRTDGMCHGKKVPIEIFLKGFKCESKSVSMTNYTVHSKEDLPEKLRFAIAINRCRSRESLDSCEEYYKKDNLDYCQAINPDGLMGNNVLKIPFKPKYKCPIKMGIYSASNFSISIAPFLIFNLEDWYWKVKGELFPYKGTRLLACMHFEAYTVSKSKS